MSEIWAAGDSKTARNQAVDHRDLRERTRQIDEKRAATKSLARNPCMIAKTATGSGSSYPAGDENKVEVDIQLLEWDRTAVTGRENTSSYSRLSYFSQVLRPGIATGGQHYEEGELVYVQEIDSGYQIIGRVEGQLWFGTTTAIIPAGGSGPVDMITAAGTVSRTAHDYFGEEIGSGVLVVGAYAPDGKNYVLAAQCEQDDPIGITEPTPNP